jgi:hypothetical protein
MGGSSSNAQSRLLLVLAFFISLITLQSFWLSSKISITQYHPSLHHPQLRTPKVIGVGISSYPQQDGSILPDGTATFTPDEFRAGRLDKYVNLPNNPIDAENDVLVQSLMDAQVPKPVEMLMHQAPNPPSPNAIVGLASYPKFMDGWRKMIGSLRLNGYEGHIIVGVNPNIPAEEREYLDKMGVTYYAVETANCSSAILNVGDDTSNKVRSVCSKGLEELKLEWGRYEMARRWLRACQTCTGWSMVIDTRDIFFQRDPFASLGNADGASHNLLFVEEIASYTNTLPNRPHRAVNIGQSMRYKNHVEPCYGKASVKAYELIQRPMLCSGTVLGTRDGIHRFLTVLVEEFGKNNAKGPLCRSPATTDQWTMNYLYYKGKFGFTQQTKTLPWGTGPVLTVGKPCVNSELRDGKSQKDMMEFGSDGLILNPHEPNGSAARVAPALHQWDRCNGWMRPWFEQHQNLFTSTKKSSDEPFVHWVSSG